MPTQWSNLPDTVDSRFVRKLRVLPLVLSGHNPSPHTHMHTHFCTESSFILNLKMIFYYSGRMLHDTYICTYLMKSKFLHLISHLQSFSLVIFLFQLRHPPRPLHKPTCIRKVALGGTCLLCVVKNI